MSAVLIDLHRLEAIRPRGPATYALPLAEALLEIGGYVAWHPGEPEPRGRFDRRLLLDGAPPQLPGTAAAVFDLAHLARRRLLAPLPWVRQNLAVAQAARRADLVVAPSTWVAERLERLLRVPSARIALVRPGLPPAFERATRAQVERLRTELELPRRYLVAVGTISPRRNLPTLLAAWREAAAGVGGAELVLAGEVAPAGRRVAAAADRTSGVRRLGYLDSRRVQRPVVGKGA